MVSEVAFAPIAAAIDTAPNIDAFTAGLEIEIFVALVTIGGLLFLNWLIKTLWSSNR